MSVTYAQVRRGEVYETCTLEDTNLSLEAYERCVFCGVGGVLVHLDSGKIQRHARMLELHLRTNRHNTTAGRKQSHLYQRIPVFSSNDC